MSYTKIAGRTNLYIRNGTYYARGPRPERQWIALRATNEKEAVADQQVRLGPGVKRPAKVNVKCADAWPEFIAAKRKAGLAEGTISRYVDMWELHGRFVLGRMRMTDVEEQHIKAVFDRMEAEGYVTSGGVRKEYTSFRQPHTALSSFFTTMMKAPFRYVTSNPCKTLGAWAPKSEGVRAIGTWVVIREDEMEKIAENAAATTYKYARINETAFRLGYNTGLRISEIAGLDWTSVLFEEGRMLVRQQLSKTFVADDPTTWYAPLKGDKDKSNSKLRYVPLAPRELKLMKEYREWLLSVGLYRADGPVFPTRRHTPISQRSWARRFEEAVGNAKIDRREGTLTPHCLRHSYASRLFSRNVPVGVISNLLGHSTEQITKDRYIHFFDTKAQDDIVRAALEG